MARTNTRRSTSRPTPGARSRSIMRRVLRPEIVGTVLVVLAAALLLYLLPQIPLTRIVNDARDELVGAFGLHVFTLVVLTLAVGLLLALRQGRRLRGRARHLAGAALLLVFSAGALGFWAPDVIVGEVDLGEASAGGSVGGALTGGGIATIAWVATLVVGFTLLWPRTALALLRAAPPALGRSLSWLWRHAIRPAGRSVAAYVRSYRMRRRDPAAGSHPYADLRAERPIRAGLPTRLESGSAPAAADPEPAPAEEAEPAQPLPAKQIEMDLEHDVSSWRHSSDGWQLPPIELLAEAEPLAPELDDQQRRAELIVETLASFGVEARVSQINEGPTVTQFGVEPGWDVRTRTVAERTPEGAALLDDEGQPRTRQIEVSRTRVRVNRITALQNDLALALATPALRIEAPVPGRSVVGIEVPNASSAVVTLRSVLESREFAKAAGKSPLPIALGSGVSGSPVVADLAEMPHLLIAGATGSGKSVCLNSIIACLLMNLSPEQLRFVLIDPKRVELAAFADVPHLAFSEIVVDMDKVVGTLQAVIHEMETRYRRFAKVGVRNIERYNEQAGSGRLPYWVVIIDELADLMLAAPYQVEHQLVRLAQLARATGIHLVVATQRPSVDVVTGLIKANFPTRIAFAVSSHVDSRTILDGGGAEKLLGKGDMLFQPKDQGKPTRLQGVYVSDGEIDDVVDFWTNGRFENLRPPSFDELIDEVAEEVAALDAGGAAGPPSSEVDPMITKALELAREHNHISTSLLQRRLRIGYPRAARVMDELEEQGVVGASEGGSGSRPVLLDADGGDAASAAAPIAGAPVVDRDG